MPTRGGAGAKAGIGIATGATMAMTRGGAGTRAGMGNAIGATTAIGGATKARTGAAKGAAIAGAIRAGKAARCVA